MAVSVGSRPSRMRTALASLLTILILLPAGFLFLRVWQDIDSRRDDAQLEKQGVEYLTTLTPLVSALAESQSSALQGVSAAPASLTAAVARVAAVDQRYGESLRSRERWSGLRTKIEALPEAGSDQLTKFQAHVETTDLALALYGAVLDNSTLSRDPDNDLSHLQEALGADLPGTVVQVSRMGDLSLLNSALTGQSQQALQARQIVGAQFGAAVQAVNVSVSSLTDNLQSAVDDTRSTTLSGNLVTTVDSFRRGVESFIRGATPGPNAAPNAAGLATAQSQLQTSLNGLAGVLVREMTDLLDNRLDDLDTRRIEALSAAGLIVLLALLAVGLALTGRRGRAGGGLANADAARDVTVGRGDAGRGDAGRGDFERRHPLDPVPPYGDEVSPMRRERSGVR